MALRLRKDGILVCAAQSEPREGDIYIDDRKHSHLVDRGKIELISEADHKYWKFIRSSYGDITE